MKMVDSSSSDRPTAELMINLVPSWNTTTSPRPGHSADARQLVYSPRIPGHNAPMARGRNLKVLSVVLDPQRQGAKYGPPLTRSAEPLDQVNRAGFGLMLLCIAGLAAVTAAGAIWAFGAKPPRRATSTTGHTIRGRNPS